MDEVKKRRVRQLTDEVRSLMRAEDFDGCLNTFRRLEEQRPLTPGELVVKGWCFQLASEEAGSLDGAQQALKAALDLDEDYVPALIELGWFHYAIRDDAKTGLSYFLRAEELSRGQLEEATEGKDKCLEELQGDDGVS